NVNNDFYFEDLIIDSFEYLWNNQGNIYLAVGDLDNDGFSDIILPEYATNTSSFSNINYYKNLNNEIFEKKVIKENSYRVSNLLIDDFNNDNRKDILITSYNTSHGNNKITLFSQNEDVTFEEKIIDQPFTPSSTSYFVDVNNDGNTDIINGKNYFKWYENKGNNNWSYSRSIVDLDSKNLYDKHYKVTDINNDGLFDIISNEGTINGGNVLKIFKNLGNNDFELSYSLSNEYLNHWHNYHIFQKNNSDFPDIYYLKTIWDHEERDKLFYVRNNNGVFEAPIEMTISPADSFFKAYEIYEMGDLNNDDLPDLILCDYNVANNKYEIIYLENLGNNEFYKHFIADTEALTFHKIVLDDYNSDGNLDIFIFDRGYQKPFKVFENNNLNFIEKIIENEFYLDDLIVYDFNEDGLTDLMTMSYDEFSGTYKMYINYFQNNGSGYDKILIDSHDTAFWGGTPEDRGGFNLFDKNGDGKLDLIITTTDHAEGYIR